MMNVLLYGSLIYVVFHLWFLLFKFGTKVAKKFDDVYLQIFKETPFYKLHLFVHKTYFYFTFPFNKKNRLIVKEFNKSYADEFSIDFIHYFSSNKQTFSELFKIVETIYSYRRGQAWIQFQTDTTFKPSEILDVIAFENEVSSKQKNNFNLVLLLKFDKKNVIDNEIDKVRTYLFENDVFSRRNENNTFKTTQIEHLGINISKADENNIENPKEEIEEQTRSLKRSKNIRFDSKKRKRRNKI
jgi:hypothetical protein